jgi:hypothetical protein
LVSRGTITTLVSSDLVSVCVDVKVTTGIRRYDEQKALAGFCCFNAVTNLVTTGHNTGLGVAAGTGFASAKATKATRMSENMMFADKKCTSEHNLK